MVNDEWVGAAMSNDMVVVELLIHLRQSQSTSAAKSHHHHLHSVTTAATAAATTPFSWGLKQRRSRLTHRWKEADSTRCSPTTPLSWSAASDESTQQPSRSKAAAASECTGNSASSTKRCRKHKSFAELKDEETVLLKEKTYLEKEIATMSASFQEQRVRNESLKRIKYDLGASSKNSGSSECSKSKQSKMETEAANDGTELQSDRKSGGRSESCGESGFLIPDLNMMPSEGDSFYVG